MVQDLAEGLLKNRIKVANSEAYRRRASRHIAINQRRCVDRRSEYEASYAANADVETRLAELEFAAREALLALEQTLIKLPAITRSIFIHCHVLGRTEVEASKHFGLHLSTVKKQLSKARRLCQKNLKDYFD